MKPEQCRAARGLVDWSQGSLADKAGVSLSTVRDFEKGRRTPIPNNLAAIRAALETAGVTFLEAGGVSTGPGVSLRKRDGAAIDVDENQVVQYRENLENDAPPGAGAKNMKDVPNDRRAGRRGTECCRGDARIQRNGTRGGCGRPPGRSRRYRNAFDEMPRRADTIDQSQRGGAPRRLTAASDANTF